MKVCILTSSIDKGYGGPARSVPFLANGLAEAGCNVTLCAVESEDMNDNLVHHKNVTFTTINKASQKKWIEQFFTNNHFDIVHIQSIWLPLFHWAIQILVKNHVPYIITPRGSLEPWSLNQKRWKKLLALHLYQRKDINNASAILATSRKEAKHLRDLNINVPIAIIPNGIDTSIYRCRTTLDYANTKKQILFLSRIHPKKGIEILINAWEQIYKSFPEWNVAIVGNGDTNYIKKLTKFIQSKKLDNISILPSVYGTDKLKFYYESSLFVLPSYSENFGMAIAEALSCGVPIITTTETPWEYVNNEKIGWCINLSVENLATSLRHALSLNSSELFDMGQKGSKYIESHFAYQSVGKNNLQLYNRVLYNDECPNMYDKSI